MTTDEDLRKAGSTADARNEFKPVGFTKDGFPILPMIPEEVIIRHKGNLKGPVERGDVFAWEPDKQHARELVVVTEVKGDRICSRNLNGGIEHWNDESRFREACQRTVYKKTAT